MRTRREMERKNLMDKFNDEYSKMNKEEQKDVDNLFEILDGEAPKTLIQIREEIKEKFDKIKED